MGAPAANADLTVANNVKATVLACVTGYSASSTLLGCYICSGSAPITGYTSCTVTGSTVTAPVCADGYYKSNDGTNNICSSCTDTSSRIRD